MTETLTISSLGHTWILDLDGTIVKHNGYILDGYDTLLENAPEFLSSIPAGDMIVFITSRTDEYKKTTELFLEEHNIHYDHIIYGAPLGERILINDRKPSGLGVAIAVNVKRDWTDKIRIEVDEKI